MTASIIISTSSNRTLFENFVFHLSEYPTINDYEIIIVNDGGEYIINDGYFHQMGIQNAHIIESQNKLGYGVANNLAVEQATCEHLIFMNDDILLKPNCLEHLISILKNENIAAVQPKLIYPQSDLIQSTGHFFTKYTNAHAFENMNINYLPANCSQKRQALTTALCATDKSTFLDAGKFSTDYFNAWEGMEYTLKLSLNGKTCWYDHEAEAYHIRGGARNQYELNEEAQSASFWSKWSGLIQEDLPLFISKQFKNTTQEYLLLNFSKLPNPEITLSNSGIKISNLASYTYISGAKSIDFFRCLPNSFFRSNMDIIYFSNNFFQLKNNLLWFEQRKNKNDLIIDLSRNVLPTYSLIKSHHKRGSK